jgi:dihydrofolate reductase
MKIYQIVAMSENHVIGQDGGIPWNIPRDMKRFKEITMGHPVIMGRKTFDSLPSPLSRRLNIVLTSQDELEKDEFKIFKSDNIKSGGANARITLSSGITDAINVCGEKNFDEVFVIGGESVYNETLPISDEVRMTIVHEEYEGDTFYPDLDENEDWEANWIEPHDGFSFIDYVRTNRKENESL